MAEATETPRAFSEDEAYAIAADRVTRETAELKDKIAQLESEKAALQTEKDEIANKLDVEITAREAAETKHNEFVAQLEAEKEKQSKKDDRIAKVREAAKHLDDEFFSDEARVDRIVAMDDEVFDGYVADLTAAATKAGSEGEGGAPPRETAMTGDPASPKPATATAASEFLTRGFFAPKEAVNG